MALLMSPLTGSPINETSSFPFFRHSARKKKKKKKKYIFANYISKHGIKGINERFRLVKKIMKKKKEKEPKS